MLELDAGDLVALNMLGDIHAQQGHVTEALQFFKQAVQIMLVQGAKEKAESIKRKMSKLDPNSVEEEPEEAQVAQLAPAETGTVKDAIETLKARVAADPKNLELIQKLSELLAKAGRNPEAAEQLLIIANALYNNRLFKKAEPVFQQILQLEPGNLQAHIALGEIFSKDGSDSEAKKEFLFVAEHLIRQGNLERGQLFAQKAIQLKSIEAHYYLGMVFYQKGQVNEARTEFETLLKFKLGHQGALTHLAQILNQTGQTEEAWGLYERLVKADPKNGDAWEKQGLLAVKAGKNDVASEKFRQAMEVFAAEEQWERAALCAGEALKVDPQNSELYLKLADASYNAGLEQQAAEACDALAELYESQGKSEEAKQIRAKAVELKNGGVSGAVASPVESPAEPPVASRSAEKNPAPVDEVKVMMNIAATYIRQGSFDDAIEIYQQIAKKDPNNEEVRAALTRAYAMFAGVNPETAVTKKAVPKAGTKTDSEEQQRLQREARERAQQEAQARAQRSKTPTETASAFSAKPASPESDLMQSMGAKEDEIAGDHQDEFMTVTVAEIYTKQGLLNEALKIYQKILEIEPGNLEAQMKKQELENTMAEQERLRQQSEEAARKKAEEEKMAAEAAAKAALAKSQEEKIGAGALAAESVEAPESLVSDNVTQNIQPGVKPPDDNPEPPGRRRGHVSYV